MKNSYILLRNNIESSSLNIEELIQIGLQETDLVWVECQSVYWQHPEEIPELRNLLTAKKHQSEISEKTFQTVPSISNKNKHVFVELPAASNSEKEKNVKQASGDEVLINMNKYGNPDKLPFTNPVEKIPATKTKHDLAFDEITASYTKRSSKNTNLENTIFGFELPQNIKKISLYIGLVVLGAVLMLLIMSNDHKNKVVVQTIPQQPAKEVTTAEPVATEETDTAALKNFEEPQLSTIEIPVKQSPDIQKTPVVIKKNSSPASTNNNLQAPAESIEKTKTDDEPKSLKKTTPENITSKVALNTNDYNIGSFGGIKNLEITLRNTSDYLLDKISVEINYLNPEGKSVGSDKIHFQSVGPGDVVTMPVKKSRRGVKVDLKVTKIESKELAEAKSQQENSLNYSRN